MYTLRTLYRVLSASYSVLGTRRVLALLSSSSAHCMTQRQKAKADILAAHGLSVFTNTDLLLRLRIQSFRHSAHPSSP